MTNEFTRTLPHGVGLGLRQELVAELQVAPPSRWQALVEDFFARHRCRTPIYRRSAGRIFALP